MWLDEAGPEPNSYPVGRVEPLEEPPAIGDGSPHGAYHWNQVSRGTAKLACNSELELTVQQCVNLVAALMAPTTGTR